MTELDWVLRARELIGVTEVNGTRHNPLIIEWLDNMGRFSNESKAWWRDDETPWCGLFVGHVLGNSGRFVVKEWYRAKAWLNPDLTTLDKPAYGCLAVIDRTGGGHVGFVVGKDTHGNVMILGGNQNDTVNITPFHPDRITGYKWVSWWIDGSPIKSTPHNMRYNLPIIKSSGVTSKNEQ